MAIPQEMQRMDGPSQPAPQQEMPEPYMDSMPFGHIGGIPEEEEDDDYLIKNLDSLSEQEKAFVTEMLTPETIKLIALVGGGAEDSQEIIRQLSPYADESRILIPVPRQEVMGNAQQQQPVNEQPEIPDEQSSERPPSSSEEAPY